MNKFKVMILAMLLSVHSGLVRAADDNGKFAVKGAGKRLCSNFLLAAEQKTTDYYLYGGWLEGYISAYNRFQPENYDATPWQTTELLLALLQQDCENSKDKHFLTVTNGLLKALFPIRLPAESALVAIDVNNAKSYFYVEILKRAKQRLIKMGYLQDVGNSDFDQATLEAFKHFQRDLGLAQTGVPDQNTLMNLFLKKSG
ncbi:hypothetical protein FX988_01772 [Paraglaciecola mesophila]|uniref:Peptidoglycan binding-like domain-containing protein n=1 Tax=Paraglaciecola mesophila TaxID=197222 RepID=A0A857JJW0_9ALTE|nr:peptidoglycan-binding domain-containing protein [Paraglaciecola mesophila]QHJ11538.1 hypothetical protein FX988_01772 [Paraglaciecola mesophila]